MLKLNGKQLCDDIIAMTKRGVIGKLVACAIESIISDNFPNLSRLGKSGQVDLHRFNDSKSMLT